MTALAPPRHRSRRAALCALLVGLGAALAAGPADARARKSKREEPVLSIRTETNATTLTVGDQFQLDVIVTVRTNAPVEELRLPTFEGFSVLRDSRSQRSSVQLSNGRRAVTLEQRYSYVLSADTPGLHKVGSAFGRVGTNKARSEPVTIRVTDASGKTPKGETSDDLDSAAGEPFFLSVSFDRPQVYVGQQATLLVQVAAQQPIDARSLEMPKLPKFWVEKLDVSSSRPSERTLRGRRYYVYNMHAAALFPLEPGEHVIGKVEITVNTGSGFWARGRSYKLKSTPVQLKVLPLPDEGRPADFERGNVGRWNLVARLSPPQTAAGQPVTLTIEAKGEGNVSAIALPRLPEEIDGLRLFPPTFTEERGVRQGLLQGTKQAEILVQPLKEGRIRLPQLSLHYFDPVGGRYEIARTRPLTLLVGPAAGGAAQGTASVGAVRSSIAKSARPVRTGLTPGSVTPLYRSGAFPFGVVTLALLSAASLLVGQRKRQFGQGAGARRRKALAYNRGALEQAVQHQNLRQVQGAVLQHLSLLFGDDVKALPLDALTAFLIGKGVGESDAAEAARVLADLEAILYAPASSGDKQRLAQQVGTLLERLEKQQGAAS